MRSWASTPSSPTTHAPSKKPTSLSLRANPRFTFHELDLRTDDLAPALDGVDTIFHLAAMGGLVAELDPLRPLHDLQHTGDPAPARSGTPGRNACSEFIYSSTSSIYGSDVTGPETTTPHPVSPYGITKLAAEHLVQAYDAQFGMPVHHPALLLGLRPPPAPRHGLLHLHRRHPARQADHGLRRRQPVARQHLRHRHSPGHPSGPRQVRARRDLQHRRLRRNQRQPGDRPPGRDNRQARPACSTPPPALANRAAPWPTPPSPSNASASSPKCPSAMA